VVLGAEAEKIQTGEEKVPQSSSFGSFPNAEESRGAQITIVGVGGAGGNIVNTLASQNISYINIVAMNTDSQVLSKLKKVPVRIRLGEAITGGLGAGSDPETGKKAAEESKEDISRAIDKADMVIVVAGMGGGTGTGAAPVIAEVAKNEGALVVGIVTLPFLFEGRKKRALALKGMEELARFVDALIVIDNEKVKVAYRDHRKGISLGQAFRLVDEVVIRGVRGITDIIFTTGTINVDFADVRSVLSEAGRGYIGLGQSRGEQGGDRVKEAAEKAINSPLLDIDLSTMKPKSVLVNVRVKHMDVIDLDEFYGVMDYIKDALNMVTIEEEELFKYGVVEDPSMDEEEVEITVVAAGLEPISRTRRKSRHTRSSSSRRSRDMGDEDVFFPEG